MEKGFTLIELLVVVLIIGILAAVAVPQYEKAVDRAALSCVMPVLKSVSQAQHLLALERGGFPPYIDNHYFLFSELSIDLPFTNWDECKDSSQCRMICGGKTFDILLRNWDSWANFHWTYKDTLDRLVYRSGPDEHGYILQCSTDRCRRVGRSLGKECEGFTSEGVSFYCF